MSERVGHMLDAFERVAKAVGMPDEGGYRYAEVAMRVEVAVSKAQTSDNAWAERDEARQRIVELEALLNKGNLLGQAMEVERELRAEVERLKADNLTQARALDAQPDAQWKRECLLMQEALEPLVPQPIYGYGAAELAHEVAHVFRAMEAKQADAPDNTAKLQAVFDRMALTLQMPHEATNHPEAVAELMRLFDLLERAR